MDTKKASGLPQRHPRVSYGGPVAVKARNSSNDSGIVKNVSQGGVYLLSAKKYLQGTELVVYLPLELGNKKTLCMVAGRITRVELTQTAQSVQGYGIQFDINLSKSSLQMLQDFVTLKKTGKLPEKKQKGRVSSNRD